MKNTNRISYILALWLTGSLTIHAQTYQVPGGSSGDDDALNVTVNTVLDLPPDGVFHYTTINVAQGVTLSFNRNANNTPVYLLATGDVTINGIINVSGTPGNTLAGGRGGPGGFDGGNPGPVGSPGGAGQGPGGGGPGVAGELAGSAGKGAYANPIVGGSSRHGQVYGGPLLIPLLGGSGGGGVDDVDVVNHNHSGGGGGGGAILICSNTEIFIRPAESARILANGGAGAVSTGNAGSGGAIRLVAPKIRGGGFISAFPESTSIGSSGRIRIDTHDRTSFSPIHTHPPVSYGSFVVARLANEPKLRILSVAGQTIAADSGPVEILLPTDSNQNVDVQLQATDFGQSIEVELALKPWNGAAVFHPVTINNSAANPATATVNVTIPGNTLLHLEAYKR